VYFCVLTIELIGTRLSDCAKEPMRPCAAPEESDDFFRLDIAEEERA